MRKRKRIKTGTYKFSKIINAPLRFVYDWCTDYREDDYKLTGSKSRRTFLEKSKRLVIYAIRYPVGREIRQAVNLVTLRPPRAWHLDSYGQEGNTFGDYRLTKLGPERTRLNMVFKEEWKVSRIPSRTEYMRDGDRLWDRYTAALEKDYKHQK